MSLCGASISSRSCASFPKVSTLRWTESESSGRAAPSASAALWHSPPHTYHWIVAGNFFINHDPQGEWLYGADMSVHPDCRGRGISRMLYNARKDLVRRLELRGMVGGGMIPGYVRYRDRMSPLEYAQAVAAGVLIDPTLTPQLRAGFELRGILPNYIEAGEPGNDSTLIVWKYRE